MPSPTPSVEPTRPAHRAILPAADSDRDEGVTGVTMVLEGSSVQVSGEEYLRARPVYEACPTALTLEGARRARADML